MIRNQKKASQPRHEPRLLHGLRVPMRDGVRLSADVYVPREPGPFPTIVTRTPYESGRDHFIELGVWWAERGYAFVVQDCRGRFESEGVFHGYFPDIEDGYDTLEWVAGQGWCDGKIGTWGRSYGALTQWLPARLESPHLSCMAPHVVCDDFFSDCHYIGGAFQLLLSLGAATIWETNLATVVGSQAGRLFQNRKFWSHLPLIELDELAIGRKIAYWREWLEHPTYDDYWKRCNSIGRQDRIGVPVFQQCGWFDPYTSAGFRSFNGLVEHGATAVARSQQRILVGPWTHEVPDSVRMGDMEFGDASLLNIREEERRWFDWQLKGVSGGVADEPPIRIFVSGSNRWVFAHQWPLPQTRLVSYYVHSGGRAHSDASNGRLDFEPPGSEPPDRFEYDPSEPVLTLGGNLSVEMMTAHAEDPLLAGPVDQRPIECRKDVLVYTSPVLEADLTVIGPVEMKLYAESSARDTDFTARLTDVDPQGRSLVLTEGIIRGRYRKSLTATELLEPNVVDEFRITLCPVSHVFLAGHCLRLDISSSNFPRFSRNLNTGEDVATGTRMQTARQTVLHNGQYPSHIVLPVVELV
jgi:putative CocE/NonD family hydrolase